MIRGLFGPGTIVLGGVAVLMITFLAIGFFLPGTWSATAETTITATPESLLEYLDSPEGWRTWTPWPDSITRTGPERGAGAIIAWESREFGTGSFQIQQAASTGVTYAVSVVGAGETPMRTLGTVTLTPTNGGTRVSWKESGDLGRNPLMGYWAMSMERAQSTELGKSLDRLAEVVGEAVEIDRSGAGSGDDVPRADSATSGSEPSR
jgi:carbon monoxide dehydrogenase subunit G